MESCGKAFHRAGKWASPPMFMTPRLLMKKLQRAARLVRSTQQYSLHKNSKAKILLTFNRTEFNMLTYHRGCVAIKGSQVNEIASKWIHQCQDVTFQKSLKAREVRDDTSDFHITVMTSKEKKLTNFDVSQYEVLESIDLYDLGIGRCKQDGNTVYYVVIVSPQLNKLRAELQLPHYDFHITLGFTQSDIHDVPKGLSTLCMKSNRYANTLHQILEKGPVELPARVLKDMGYLAGVFYLFKCVVKSMELKERYDYLREEVLCREYKQLVSGEDYGGRLVKILNRLSGRTQQSCGKPIDFYTYEIQDGVYQFKTYQMPRNFSFYQRKLQAQVSRRMNSTGMRLKQWASLM